MTVPLVPDCLAPYALGSHIGPNDKLTVIVPEVLRGYSGHCEMCAYEPTNSKPVGFCSWNCPGETSICLDPKDAEAYVIAQVTRRIVGKT